METKKTPAKRKKCGCKGCYYNDIENVIKDYTELKKYRKIIKTIEPDYFFDTVDAILQEYKNLKEENKSLREKLEGAKTVIDIERAHNREVETEYDKLKEENESLEKQIDRLLDEQEEREKYTHSLEEQLKNSIPKVKVEEKIRKAQHYKKLSSSCWDNNTNYDYAIKVLEELLENEGN